jgi:hypothetical protein
MSKVRTFPHGNRKYPWDVWESGSEYIAKKGVHFNRKTSVRSFQNGLHVHAAKIGRKVKTSIVSKTEVWFQFVNSEEANREEESRESGPVRR